MKKQLLIFVAFLFTAFIMQAKSNPEEVYLNTNRALAKFEQLSHDFGEITKGIPVTKEFKFTNKGDVPLLISEVKTSCGCTATNWSKEPVLPGSSSSITVNYSAAKAGQFNKTITVMSNAEGETITLRISGSVVD